MVKCLECGASDNFEYSDGTGYCVICGTQSQDIREEVVELDETLFNTTNTTVRRLAKGLNSSRLAPAPDQIWTVAEALQIILLQQTCSLLQHGIALSFKNTVGNLWFRFLAKIGKVKIPGIEPVVLTEPYEISIYDNLVIMYLALRLIHYPILVSDIVSWITDGMVCFFNASYLLPAHFQPRKLLKKAFGILSIPTVNALQERIAIMIEIIDDIIIPELHYSALYKRFTDVCLHYQVINTDVLSVCIGLLDFFYKFESHHSLDLPVATSFLMAIRLHFQFEIPESEKSGWLSWFVPYLNLSFKNNIENAVGVSLRLKHCYVTECYFLNLSKQDYYSNTNAIIPQYVHVMKTKNVNKDLKEQFLQLSVEKSTSGFTLDIEDSVDKAFKTKLSGKGRCKRECLRTESRLLPKELIIYPIDRLVFADNILPLEMEIIMKDISAKFSLKLEDLFTEMQKIGNALII